jgi:hypothetical protein
MIASEIDLTKPFIFEVADVLSPEECRSWIERIRTIGCYTFMVYLNEEFEGGETRFFVEPEVVIKPNTGSALFFQHPIIHEGGEVHSGIKYVLRTDLVYRRV